MADAHKRALEKALAMLREINPKHPLLKLHYDPLTLVDEKGYMDQETLSAKRKKLADHLWPWPKEEGTAWSNLKPEVLYIMLDTLYYSAVMRAITESKITQPTRQKMP
ncbi:MAG: hypothetical protein WC045_00105 [Patescibacteria group bacterium]